MPQPGNLQPSEFAVGLEAVVSLLFTTASLVIAYREGNFKLTQTDIHESNIELSCASYRRWLAFRAHRIPVPPRTMHELSKFLLLIRSQRGFDRLTSIDGIKHHGCF